MKMRCARHVTYMGEMRKLYRIWVGKPEGKISLWRHIRIWEDNIKINLKR
jgi:hypothetical protein